jgi:peptidoglycan/LPS O-acetylase OafA/YrhL
MSTEGAVSMSLHRYRPDIDGLRALAVISVVLFHAFPAWLPGGFVGVDVFFVISGYLITGIIATEMHAQRFSMAGFYARRVLRIFPALLLVLSFCLIVGWFVLLQGEYQELAKHTLAGIGFIQNLVLWSESGYFDAPAEAKVLLHLWSLGIEEQFYIVWPIALALLWCFKANLRAWVLTGAIASFAYNLYQAQVDPTADFYSPLTRFWELLVGAWLALTAQSTKDGLIVSRQTNLVSLFGLALIVGSLFYIDRHMNFPGGWALLPVAGAACLIASAVTSGLSRVVLSNKVMVWFGLISYPLYLWHWPLLTFAKMLNNGTPSRTTRLLLVGLAILLAWLTYRLIERPLRFNLRSKGIVVSALLSIAMVLAVFGYAIHQAEGLSFRRVALENRDTSEPIVLDAYPITACLNLAPDDFLNQFCQQRSAPDSKKTIIVWGDSSAIAWAPVFEAIAKQKGYSLIRIAMLSCPPLVGVAKVDFPYLPAKHYCSDGLTQQKVIDHIDQIKPDLVVVIAAWNQYSANPPRERLFDARKDVQRIGPDTTMQVLESGVMDTISTLSKISKVLVFRSWPIFAQMPNARSVSSLGIAKTEATVPQRSFIEDTKRVNEVFNSLASKRVSFFSPAEKICDGVACHSELGGIRFYSDLYHITARGSLTFQSELELRIEQAMSDR